MIRIFYVMSKFYYMVFTRHSVGKIWSSGCVQDIYYTLSDYFGAINLARFLYQIYLINKSHENGCFYVENTERIKILVKHLCWNVL